MALSGDYGKPRPALVIQSNSFLPRSSLAVLPLTTALPEAPLLRITVQPDGGNGLRAASRVLIDKPSTVPVTKAQAEIGRLDDAIMLRVERLLALFLGIVK